MPQRRTIVIALGFVFVSTANLTAIAQDNIARAGTARQSSDFAPNFGAERAIDGELGNFTATATADTPAIWEVEFGAEAEIERIVVHNRGDGCCQSRLRDITIAIYDISFLDDPFGDEEPLWESELLNEQNELGGMTTAGPPELAVDLDDVVAGTFVRVTRLGDPELIGTGGEGNADEANVMSLGEVEVFGTIDPVCPAEGDAEFGDTECSQLSVNGPLDGGPGLYLVSAVGADVGGDEILYTFVAEEAGGTRLVRDADPVDFVEFDLGVGEWSLSVIVDDDRLCDDTSENAMCTEAVTIEPPEGPNKALQRPSRQSSDFNANLGASRGNDGEFGNFTATASADDAPWWEVDLLEDIAITSIVVSNRGDGCCQSRLRDITVTVFDGTGDDAAVVFESELLNEENELGGGGLDGPPVLSLDLTAITGDAVTGRVVRVSRLPDPDLSGTGGLGNVDEPNVLSLGEVEVFDDVCDASVAVCDGLDVFGPEDGGPGAYTAIATGSGAPEIFYTFTADNGTDPALVIGPQALDSVTLQLGVGTWTITSTVTDSRRCVEPGPDGSCSESVEISALGVGENVAFGKPATQTSDFTPALGASLAVDGILGNFTATAGDDVEPSWEVDLEGEFAINAIVLHNRGDGCCQSRLRDITVSILDGAGALVWESELLNEENELGGGTTDGPARLVVDLRDLEGDDIVGSRVRVSRLVDDDLSGSGGVGGVDEANVLSLGEVEVFSGDDGPPDGIRFIRGDADSSGVVNITDGIFALNFLFLGGPDPSCADAADADDSSVINITDGIYILNFLFLGGPNPPAPHPDCDAIETVDLGCEETSPSCAAPDVVD